jgi:thymidylate kinase
VEIVRGKFITLEGMDGAGKSTHIPDIIKLLELKAWKSYPLGSLAARC